MLPDISRHEQTAFSQHSWIIFLIVSSQNKDQKQNFLFFFFLFFFLQWEWCNMRSSSHTRTSFLPRLHRVALPLGVGLWGGEQEVKGGRGQHGTVIFSTFDKAALSDILGRNSLKSLVKLVQFQSTLYEILRAYLKIKAEEVTCSNHPSENWTGLIETRLYCRKEMVGNLIR